jgi:integrase
MMAFRVSITKQDRKRKLGGGRIVVQTRYFVNYRDPKTGLRRLPSFERKEEAQEFRNKLVTAIETGAYAPDRKRHIVAKALDHWLDVKRGQVRRRTLIGYLAASKYIKGPLLSGTSKQRAEHTRTGRLPEGSKLIKLIGNIRLSELTTADIRAWHMTLQREISIYAANRAKMLLGAVLALAEEDFGVRAPRMPTQLGRGSHKVKKAILSSPEIAKPLGAAREDKLRGVYYAFPFLAGTRPGEQLALLWEDIDFDRNILSIRRTQETDGTLADFTKTEAGIREVPMCSMLRDMLLEWRLGCPRRGKELHRVFPGPGRLQPWPMPRLGGGGPLRYQNFRNRLDARAHSNNPVPKRLRSQDSAAET